MKDRSMPHETLRTMRAESNGYDGYKDYPIYFNKPQMELLAKTEKYGMTPAIINAWSRGRTEELGYLCDKKAWGEWKAVGEYLWSAKKGKYIEFSKASHSAYGLTRDTLFTAQHQAAVEDLICKKNMKPLDAIAEISHISGDEALLIARFLDVGLTNAVLIANRPHQIYQSSQYERIGNAYYAIALDFLIRKQELSLNNAMLELQNLSPSQMKVLVDLYDDGLRGDHIRQAGVVDACKRYADMTVTQSNDLYAAWVNYFKKLFRDGVQHGKTPTEALTNCASQLPKVEVGGYGYGTDYAKTMKFALKYFDRGVRIGDLSLVYAGTEARKAFASLRILARLSVTDAVAELRGLDADEMTFLRKHYRHGVRNKHLIEIKHDTSDIEFLMKTYELTPLKALEIAHDLTPFQMDYVREFAAHGLTLDEAKSLQLNSGIDRDKIDVALFLVQEKSFSLVMAIQHVAEKSGKDLVDLMKVESLKLNSIRL